MRITYLHQYFNTPEMPGGIRSHEMARRLVARGHDVNMITSWREEDRRTEYFVTKEAGIRVHWIPVPYSNKMGFGSRIRAFFTFAWKAARKAASLKADIVFATSTPLTVALPGAYAAWKRDVPMVFEIRDLWPEVPIALGVIQSPLLKKMAKWLERFAYDRSTAVVALAPGMADGVFKTGVNKKRVAIIPNGCDIAFFKRTNSRNEANKRKPEKQIILYVGHIGRANGVEYVIQLAKAMLDFYPTLEPEFVIIGDGQMFPKVKSLGIEEGVLGKNVRMLGAMPKIEIPKWLKMASATIMTYDGPEILFRDSVSNKFFDSLAAGKPIFANFEGFSTLIAKSCGAGVILPKNDFEMAAHTVSKFLEDPKAVHQAAVASFHLGHRFFNREKLALDLEKVFIRVLEGGTSLDRICEIGSEYRDLWMEARHGSSNLKQ